MASIIKVDRILDSTGINPVEIPVGLDTGIMNADQLVSDTWKSQDGTENYKCKAFVNFDGSTTPPTIRASGNVSSVVGNGTGDYTVNFTTAMPDDSYATVCAVGGGTTGVTGGSNNIIQVSSGVNVRSFRSDTNQPINSPRFSVAVFR